jgi:hypothetical protein
MTSASPRWKAVIDMKGTTAPTSSDAALGVIESGRMAVSPLNFNTSIAPNAVATFNFCGKSTSATQRPVIQAWNFQSNAYATCGTNSGLLPTKAALAVAMATELGRWDALTDLVVDGTGQAVLSAAGLAKCTNSCKNTKALLKQQDPSVAGLVSTTTFSPDMYRSDLNAAFQRQKDKIQELKNNNPAGLPPAHKLTRVGGPLNLGIGACGPHYVFQADRLDGTPLTATEASNLARQLCFFGYGSCGGNSYLAYTTTTTQCPAGRTCVAVDPTDGDNSAGSTTTAGSAPTYPLNRAYDPANTLLNTGCVTTAGKYGTMLSKCTEKPASCGYLYCTPPL